MVILNKEILMCKISMEKSIKNIMNKYFENEKLIDKIENKKKL